MTKAAIILAAGQGTRMKSVLPKVLHKVAGLPLLGHVVAALKGAGVAHIVVVTSAAGEDVRAYAKGLGAASAIQHQQLGTGHAAASARDALGELCNMVAGNFKAKVSSLADACMLSVPTVIAGEDYSMDTAEPAEGVTIALVYENENIWITLVTHS